MNYFRSVTATICGGNSVEMLDLWLLRRCLETRCLKKQCLLTNFIKENNSTVYLLDGERQGPCRGKGLRDEAVFCGSTLKWNNSWMWTCMPHHFTWHRQESGAVILLGELGVHGPLGFSVRSISCYVQGLKMVLCTNEWVISQWLHLLLFYSL